MQWTYIWHWCYIYHIYVTYMSLTLFHIKQFRFGADADGCHQTWFRLWGGWWSSFSSSSLLTSLTVIIAMLIWWFQVYSLIIDHGGIFQQAQTRPCSSWSRNTLYHFACHHHSNSLHLCQDPIPIKVFIVGQWSSSDVFRCQGWVLHHHHSQVNPARSVSPSDLASTVERWRRRWRWQPWW